MSFTGRVGLVRAAGAARGGRGLRARHRRRLVLRVGRHLLAVAAEGRPAGARPEARRGGGGRGRLRGGGQPGLSRQWQTGLARRKSRIRAVHLADLLVAAAGGRALPTGLPLAARLPQVQLPSAAGPAGVSAAQGRRGGDHERLERLTGRPRADMCEARPGSADTAPRSMCYSPSNIRRSNSKGPAEGAAVAGSGARCCVTRIVPGVDPTAWAASSADNPTATRSTSTSLLSRGQMPPGSSRARTAITARSVQLIRGRGVRRWRTAPTGRLATPEVADGVAVLTGPLRPQRRNPPTSAT